MAFFVPMVYDNTTNAAVPTTAKLSAGNYVDNAYIFRSTKQTNALTIDPDNGGLYVAKPGTDIDMTVTAQTTNDPGIPTTMCGGRDFIMGKPYGWVVVGPGLGIPIMPIIGA